VVAAQGEGELHQRALVAAAVEPDAVAALGAVPRVALHQLGAVDAIAKALAERVRRPDHGHAVGHHHRRAAQRGEHLRVVLGDHQRVDRRRADVAALVAVDQLVHHRDRALVVDHRHGNPEDLAGLEVRLSRRGGLRLGLLGVHCDRRERSHGGGRWARRLSA
jgi:hypothetical protein